MNETLSYGGHSIDLEMHEMRSGRLRYTYFIDALYCFQNATDASTIDDARRGAIAHAHRSIEALNCLRQRFPAATSRDLHSAVGASASHGADARAASTA